MVLSAHALGALEQPRECIYYAQSLQNASKKIQADHHVWMKDQSHPNVLASSLKLITKIEKEGLTCALLLALLLGMVVDIYSASSNTNGTMKYSDQFNGTIAGHQWGTHWKPAVYTGENRLFVHWAHE